MKIRYFLKPSKTPIAERTLNELVYASVANKFAKNVDGKISYTKFEYSLETYVKPHHFGMPKTKRGTTNFQYDSATIEKYSKYTSDLRQAILNFDASVKSTVLFFRNAGIRPNRDEFKNRLELFTMRNDGVQKIVTLVNYIEKRLEVYNSIKGTGDARAISQNTIQNIHSLLMVIKNYEEVKDTVVTFINLKDVYSDLWSVADGIVKGKIALAKKDGERKRRVNINGIATNTIINYQTHLRDICRDAINDGIDVSLSVTNSKLIHNLQTSSKQYSINNEDLLTIYHHTPSTPRLQIAKDYIIFSSLAGMRLQSVLEVVGNPIEKYNRDGKMFDYVYTVQSKTGTECHTPLFEPAREVIVRNGGTLPNFSKYHSTINTQIKDLFKEAGITYKVPVTKHYLKDGAVTTYESVSKIVSSHATRKGFVTNLYEYGVNTTTSKLVTHPDSKDAGTADSYNKITNDVRAVRFFDEVKKNITDNELYRF
jgi:hypothetical protein